MYDQSTSEKARGLSELEALQFNERGDDWRLILEETDALPVKVKQSPRVLLMRGVAYYRLDEDEKGLACYRTAYRTAREQKTKCLAALRIVQYYGFHGNSRRNEYWWNKAIVARPMRPDSMLNGFLLVIEGGRLLDMGKVSTGLTLIGQGHDKLFQCSMFTQAAKYLSIFIEEGVKHEIIIHRMKWVLKRVEDLMEAVDAQNINPMVIVRLAEVLTTALPGYEYPIALLMKLADKYGETSEVGLWAKLALSKFAIEVGKPHFALELTDEILVAGTASAELKVLAKGNRAAALIVQGRTGEAVDLLPDVNDIDFAEENPYATALNCLNWVQVWYVNGSLEKAENIAYKGLELAESIGVEEIQAFIELILCDILVHLEKFEEAEGVFSNLEKHIFSLPYSQLGWVYLTRGLLKNELYADMRGALTDFKRARQYFVDYDNKVGTSLTSRNIAYISSLTGSDAQMRKAIDDALRDSRSFPHLLSFAKILKADWLKEHGEHEKARRLMREVVKGFNASGFYYEEADALDTLALWARRPKDGLRLSKRAHRIISTAASAIDSEDFRLEYLNRAYIIGSRWLSYSLKCQRKGIYNRFPLAFIFP